MTRRLVGYSVEHRPGQDAKRVWLKWWWPSRRKVVHKVSTPDGVELVEEWVTDAQTSVEEASFETRQDLDAFLRTHGVAV